MMLAIYFLRLHLHILFSSLNPFEKIHLLFVEGAFAMLTFGSPYNIASSLNLYFF